MSSLMRSTSWSSPGSLLLKMRLGEAPDHTPAMLDVNQGVRQPGTQLDGGPIDRIVKSHAGGLRAARLHPAAINTMTTGERHKGYDEIEQLTGVARTFLLRVAPGAPIEQLCSRLMQIPSVETASPNYLSVTPFDLDTLSEQDYEAGWGSRRMVRMAEALAYESGDSSVLLGLIDSGVEAGHQELAEVFRAGYDTVRLRSYDVAPGINLLGDHQRDDYNPTDQFVGHGMACAGIIAAAGINMPAGLGGMVRIIPMRALGAVKLPGKSQPVGLGAISDLDMAMKLAVDLGAKVINMSFGSEDSALDPSSPRPHSEIVDYALSRGCILVAASGNNGKQTHYWPAAYPEVIAVGAVDQQGRPTVFSTTGDHVALCAPGERVLTTALTGYQFATGTSFAAPFVSATTALLVARAARRATPLNGAIAKDILMGSAQPFSEEVKSVGCGAGILDAAAALQFLDKHIDQSIGSNGGGYE